MDTSQPGRHRVTPQHTLPKMASRKDKGSSEKKNGTDAGNVLQT